MEEDDACSVASSTSDWVLEETCPPKQENAITMNQGQYECVVELLNDPRYSGRHWTLIQPLPAWSDLLKLKNQRIPLPLYYNWLGVLKIGLTAHKCPDGEELYSALMKAIQPLMAHGKDDLRLRCSLVGPNKSPYSFVTLCHVGDGKFLVERSKTLGKMTKFTNKKVGMLTKEADKMTDFSEHIRGLVATSKRQYSHRKLPSLSHGMKLAQYPSIALKNQLYASLDEAIRDPTGEQKVESLEGVHSADFYSLLELSFAHVYTKLVEEGDEDIDPETVKQCMYESSTLRGHNKSLYHDIGSSVEEFIKSNGMEIIESLKEANKILPLQECTESCLLNKR